MSWLVIATIGYLLNAMAFVADKALLGTKIKNPQVYTFYIGILGLVALFLWPLGVTLPGLNLWLLDLLSGALFVVALMFFFTALKQLETSRVVPYIGGLMPVITFILSYWLLGERLLANELIAFAVLLLGGIIITLDPVRLKTQPAIKRGWIYATMAALMYSSSFVLTKYLYDVQPFMTVFVWARIGSFLAALALLFNSEIVIAIKQSWANLKTKTGMLFLSSQSVGAAGFIMQNVAIKLASPTLVNALQGTQYLFLLILVVVTSFKYPKLLKEQLTPKLVGLKLGAIIFISYGLWLLAG